MDGNFLKNTNSGKKQTRGSNINQELTNDFDLGKAKIPPLSTIKSQLKKCEELLANNTTIASKIEFDRIKIAVNLIKYGQSINFQDLGLEDALEPWKSPSYKYFNDNNEVNIDFFTTDKEESPYEPIDIDTFFESEEFKRQVAEIDERNKAEEAEKPDLFKDTCINRRIRYEDYRDKIGLNNLYITKGFLVIDITGKWMADNGYLGSLHKDNIELALQKILDIEVVNFDLKALLKIAQVFLCDVCVDISFTNSIQCKRIIDGISSFFPLATNRFKISKYDKHGLQLIPKAKNKGYSLVIYFKGAEISYSLKRWAKAEKYTFIIGNNGMDLADKTLRFEVKLQKLDTIRKVLGLKKTENRVVTLTDILSSTAKVIINQFELFCGASDKLLNSLEWLKETRDNVNNLSFNEIIIAERIAELLQENKFDLNILRSHIRTEYPNVKDSEIKDACALANLRGNILNFLVYHKPKSITIMLEVLHRLYLYYATENAIGVTNVNE